MATALTNEEKVFLARMAHHAANGHGFDTAARMVLADDRRIWIALQDRDAGPAILDQMAADVWHKCRAA
jgi:hypothetical protein